MNDQEFVRFVDVQKTFDGETLVVKDLSLSMRKGEFLTLLGPSGSGKTTTLLMLAGFERPTGGEIHLAGQPLSRVPPHKRDLGMVFQDYALFPHMNVFENVAFPLGIRKLPKTEIGAKVTSVLEIVKLAGFEDRRPNQLSGGQQQRVALARALVFGPRLVLMDEPLGALDKQLREQMQLERVALARALVFGPRLVLMDEPLGALDKQLREQMQLEIKHIQEDLGITVVYVTHDQQEALTMSDRIAVFNDGRIYQLDTPDELYENPRNSFVAQFIGENNRLPGTVVGLAGELCEVELDGGGTVKALPVNVGEVGSKTQLSVRPERVAIDGEAGGDANRLEARIEELIYQGDTTRVRVRLACGVDDFVVKLTNARRQEPLPVGGTITVSFSAEDCRALDEP